MQIELNFFQSKLARRMFLLFVLSSLVPILLLSAFQLLQMNHQLNESRQIQARQDVKNIGMVLIGRLFQIENQLNLLARAVSTLPLDTEIENNAYLTNLIPDFTAIGLVRNKHYFNLKGLPITLPDSFPKLAVGSSLLYVQNEQTYEKNRVFMFYRINQQDYLIGRVGPIWDVDIGSDDLFWVIGNEGQILYRNTDKPLPNPIHSMKAGKDSAVFTWDLDNVSYYTAYWSLFLRQRLNSNSWVVVLAVPKMGIFSQANQYTRIVFPIIAFALLLSIFFSQAQIRRSLTPLEQLRDATRRIAKRDFTSPIEVNSGDEFEELGHAFNSMSKRLNQQFQTMSILSILDQMILSTQNSDQILQFIYSKLKEVADYDALILAIMHRQDPRLIRLFAHQMDSFEEEEFTAELAEEELAELSTGKILVINMQNKPTKEYLLYLPTKEIGYAMVFPIIHHSQAVAFMVLGFRTLDKLEACNSEELRDIFYRATVAYTHAEWEERLYRQAHYDDLTNLPNRLVLRDQMLHAMERADRHKQHCALIYIDLDNFKDINDSLGHSVGDLLLAKVAATMRKTLGQLGLLARIGGDEFTLLMSDIETADLAKQKAVAAAEHLIAAFASPISLAEVEYQASASMGIVLYPDDCKTSDELLKYADMSMYKAKASGKDRYEFFSYELGTIVRERNEMLQDMHHAMQNNQFLIFFQAKIDCRNNSLCGAEVLIRWLHPSKGLMPPDAFLHLAEDSNIIFPLGRWVIQSACEQLVDWQNKGYAIDHLSINIAARQFTQSDLATFIGDIIQKTKVDPRNLEFEITESALIGNFEETILILKALNSMGCALAIDDFGTGYSSMSYLRTLPLNTMKIDRLFVQHLPGDMKDTSIVKAIITLAKNLNMNIVGEGVETLQQSQLLNELGCSVQQGFYFSEPLSAEDFTKKYLVK